MAVATPDPLLLWTIDKLEQSLVVLRPNDDAEGALRAKIEEAIEVGYEVAYSRPSRHLAQVVDFPDRRRTRASQRMRNLVDKLTAELTEEYDEHLQTLLIDLRPGEEAELWVGFSLQSDQILRQLTLRVDADAGQEEASIRDVFQQVEAAIKTALAAERHHRS